MFSVPDMSARSLRDRRADLVDLERRLLEREVDPLAEADDRVRQRPGRLLVRVDVLLQLGGDAVELLEDGPLVVLHADRLVEEPDDGELVVLEVAEDLAGELVERRADLGDVEEGVAGDPAAAVEVGVGGRRQGADGRAAHALELDARQAVALVDPALAGAAEPGRGRGGRGAERGRDDRAAAVAVLAAAVALGHLQDRGGAAVLLADGLVAGDVGGVGQDGQLLPLALAVAGQRRVEVDGLLDRVLPGEGRRRQRREDHDVHQQGDAPGRQQVPQPGPAAPPGPELGRPGRTIGARGWDVVADGGRGRGGAARRRPAPLIRDRRGVARGCRRRLIGDVPAVGGRRCPRGETAGASPRGCSPPADGATGG